VNTTPEPSSGYSGTGGAFRPLLSLEGISKSFPGVRALNNVCLSVTAGRGHALVGENGAGKSTLIKIIAGLQRPDAGTISIDGVSIAFRSPAEAHRRGIALVPQEISLVPNQSVAENIFMGHLPHTGVLVRRRELRRRSQEILDRLDVNVSPGALLGEQSPAVRQLVMIARGIAQQGRLFILDEPTAALTDPEIERLFSIIRDLKAEGAAVIYVSHRLAELPQVADDVTVLRDGEVVNLLDAQTATEDELVRSMIGRNIERYFSHGHARITDRVRLSVQGLGRKGAFEDVSFSIRSGEVVGLAGLVGAGRTEVARAIYGLDRLGEGTVIVDGAEVNIRSPKSGIQAGVVLVPEERKTQGLILGASISDNIVLPHLNKLSPGRWIRPTALHTYSARAAKDVGVKAQTVGVTVGSLSGGNQQKVVLGRWLTDAPGIYILDEPTRGVDVGSKEEIYALIERVALNGAAVLVISSELPELIGICDRILVMAAGRLVGEQDAKTATEESILAMAMGADAL